MGALRLSFLTLFGAQNTISCAQIAHLLNGVHLDLLQLFGLFLAHFHSLTLHEDELSE